MGFCPSNYLTNHITATKTGRGLLSLEDFELLSLELVLALS